MGKTFIPHDRILVTREVSSSFYSSGGSVDLYYSDDYFLTSNLIFNQVESIMKTDHFIYISTMHRNGYNIELYGAKYQS